MTLDPDDRRILLAAARDAVEAWVQGRGEAVGDGEGRPELKAKRGAFVTLRRPDGALRGCIGDLTAAEPLARTVRRAAVAAASRDPRFDPVEASELDGLRLSISALTAPTRARPEDVQVGRHGVLIERGPRRGVLLPSVATDHGWDRATLLREVCRKAGLAEDAIHHPETRLSVFASETFAD